jgi:lincosamide nucleotidyltransferase
LISHVRRLCHDDERLVAVLTYGSFAHGEADEHSDVEFWLFARTDSGLDGRAWLDRLGPIELVVVNESGAHVVVFPGLIRGEFHFAGEGDIASVATWPARGAPTDRMIVLDRTGELRRTLDSLPADVRLPATREETDELCGRFANWLLLAHHVARRGELLRAVDALGHARRHLLWMVRLAENRTQHWLTPSRNAEIDLPSDVVAALYRTVGDASSLSGAIASAWSCGRDQWQRLAGAVPDALLAEMDAALGR